MAKFREIMKMAKFGTKNASFGHFCARTFKKLLSYLKSGTSNLCKCRFREKKRKCLNLGGKKSIIWVFLGYNF